MNAEKLVKIGNLLKNEFEYEDAYEYYLEAAIGECNPEAIENMMLQRITGESIIDPAQRIVTVVFGKRRCL